MIEDYYNRLAPYYKLMLQDWNASVNRQAAVLDGVIREFFGEKARSVLDAACGIGTQSIGLAQLGYQVMAADISPAAVELARAEAGQRGLQIAFAVIDLRQLSQSFSQPFDLVIACDNAIPHLLSDAEIRQAFEQFHACTVPNGGCVISVRDYASMERGGRKFYPRQVHQTENGTVIVFDVWKIEGDFYDFTTYIVEDKGGQTAPAQVIRGGRYYCVTIETLEKLMGEAGFQQVVTLQDRFYQPLLVGMKA